MHEYDQEVIVDILENMLWALDQIQKRFEEIDTPSDFLDSDIGLEKLGVLNRKQSYVDF